MSRKLGEIRRHRSRRWWTTGATLVAVAVFAVVFVAASGAVLTGSTFEGSDGNLIVDTAGQSDWQSFQSSINCSSGAGCLVDTPSGSTDNAFGQGTKEDDPAVTIVDGSIPPNKNDLDRSYIASESVSGNLFLYLAWERLSNTGSANIDFELNQNATAGWDGSTTGALTINRTAGDLLITYDFGGSGTPTIGLLTWVTSGSTSQCYASHSLPCWGNHIDMSGLGFAEAGVNTAPVSDPIRGTTLGTGLFGEAALNLSSAELNVFQPHTCKSFGSMFVKSRSSGSSIDAELKDFIAPTPIHVGNCGSIELKKAWVGTKGNVTLKIGTSAGGTQTASTSLVGADGTTGAKSVEDGTYYVAEGFDSPTNAADYSTSLACTDNGSPVTPGASDSLSVTQGHDVVCTYTNTRNTGSIELKKAWSGTKGNVTLNIGTAAGGSQVDSQALVGADGTTGANTVATGTYYVSEAFDSPTSSSDYTTVLACTDNGSAVTPGASNSLAVASGHNVVCTFTNTRKQGSIELKKVWSGTKGNVTLKIGTAAGGSQVDSQALVGADGTTGANTVDTGTYYVSESFDSPTNAADYATALVCTDNNSPVTPGTDNSLAVASGHNVVCTFTNTRKQGSIELKKVWSGTKGNVTLKIGTAAGGSQVDSQALVGADGTTGANTVDTGTYYVSESFDSPTNAADYTAALDCTDNGSPVAPGASNSLAVTSGHSVVCTFTNTRKQGSIELKKTWVGDKGNVTLKIGTTAGASDTASTPLVGTDGTTGTKAVNTGTYYVSETFNAPTSAAGYSTSLTCTDNGDPVTPGASNSLAVASGHVVICTFTNSQQPQIELKKVWSGTKGNVTLKIGTAPGGSQTDSQALVGADGTTGVNTVNVGTYYVSESFDSPTNAADYTTALVCTDNASPVTPGTDNSLSLASGHSVVCTFTNTRKQGSIELKKTWVGDKGNVTLKIGTAAGGSQVDSQALVGADGTTGANTVDTGTYYVSESFNTPTNAADYDTTLSCVNGQTPVTPGAQSSIAVGASDQIVCTFTNSQRPKIELKKTWAGTKGNVTLKVGTTAGASDTATKSLVGADGTTGTKTVDVGTYFVSESFDTPTNAGDYTTALDCTKNGNPVTPGTDQSLALAHGDSVVCTFTNTRNQASIEVKKTWIGDKGNVTLKIGTSAGGSQTASKSLVGADGTTGTTTVDTGTYYVSESFDSPTNGSDYATTLDCVKGETPVTPGAQGSITVGPSDHVVCTFTNSRLPQVKLVKSLDPSSDSGTFDFAIGEQSFKNGGGGYGDTGTTGFVNVQPGATTISESGNGDTDLSDYDSSISCSNDQTSDGTTLDLSNLAYGDKVTCTFTNVRRATIEIVKQTLGSGGTFDFTLNGPGADDTTPFQLSPASSGATDTADYSVSPGDYTVVEAAKAGWVLTGLSCSTGTESSSHGSQDQTDSSQANVHVTAGGFVQCTYTNTKLATLIVVKIVDNSNGGGSKGPGDFSIHVSAAGLELPGSPAAGSSSGTTYSGLLPGTYKVSEDAVSGYNLTSISGCLADGSVVLAAGATVTCTLTNTSNAPPPPPPPPPPAPKVDIQITKTGTPNPVTVGKQVTWTMVVTNNGPNGATNVTVADPVPAGTTFVSVSSSAGTCTGGAVVNCQLGSLAVGASDTITLVTTAGQTGTLTNTATTVAAEQETNTANNTATASVVAIGPFVPPVKYCTAVSVAPKKTLFVGRKTTLTLKVTQNGKAVKGIRIKIKGAKLAITTTPSNAQGVVRVTLKPTKAGIVSFAPVASTACSNPRIGVTGVFTPPVTG